MPVLVSNDFPPDHGGIQRCMSRIAEELSRRAQAVTVIAPQTSGSRAYDADRHFTVRRYRNSNRFVGVIAMTAALVRARISGQRSYILASMWFPAGLAACLLPRFMRGRLGVLAHGSEIAPSRGGIRRHVMRYVFKRADAIIANSRFTRELLVRAGITGTVTVVHLGIDDTASVPNRTLTPTILSVGRLVRRKGFDKMIASMPAILEDWPNARYEIVGDGPQRKELDELARSLGVSHAVIFHGALSDDEMQAAYSRASIFALPVRAVGDDVEGFGLVYLEAALAGLATIGGSRSGAEDAIADGETGLLVDGTSLEAVTDAVRTLLNDPTQAALMGARGRERALRDFTWSATAQRIDAILGAGARGTTPEVARVSGDRTGVKSPSK